MEKGLKVIGWDYGQTNNSISNASGHANVIHRPR